MSAIGLTPDQPCGHPECLSHTTHPCEGCGRIAGHIIPAIGKKYKHKKGGIYIVLTIAKHTETEEKLVIYTPTNERGCTQQIEIWARPYDMFCDGRFTEYD